MARRRKSASERRQQHVRAEGRVIQRLLVAFQTMQMHRGNSLNRLGLALLAVLSARPSTAMQAGSRVPVPPPPPPPPRPVPAARVPSAGEQVTSAMRATAPVFVPAAAAVAQAASIQSSTPVPCCSWCWSIPYSGCVQGRLRGRAREAALPQLPQGRREAAAMWRLQEGGLLLGHLPEGRLALPQAFLQKKTEEPKAEALRPAASDRLRRT